MNRSLVMVTCVFVLLLCSQALNAAWDTVIFRDDFDVPGPLDPDDWVINHPGYDWWVMGRSHFPNPENTSGYLPYVENGVAVIEHHHYNPYDLSSSNTTFVGGEFHTTMEFDATRSYRFEARVKSGPYPDPGGELYPCGLVTSFFLYGWDQPNLDSDEIDFEFLSTQINDDPVLTNTWNDSYPKEMYVQPDGVNLSDWQTFIIYWFPGEHRVDWKWINPVTTEEEWLRTEDDAFFVPDEPMQLYFNFWAPGPGWPDAYCDELQPVDDIALDQTFRYQVDYVEFRVPEPMTCTFLAAGAGLLLARHRRRMLGR